MELQQELGSDTKKFVEFFYLIQTFMTSSLGNRRRSKKDPPIIHVIWKLASLMPKNTTIEKYVDRGIPMGTIWINNYSVSKTLIYLGFVINVKTIETKKCLNLPNIPPIAIILELVDRSKVVREGVLE